MRIGVPGSGLMRREVGTIFARAGHDVALRYARSPAKLDQAARDAPATLTRSSPRPRAELAAARRLPPTD